jgi:hypothetical protein
MGHAGLISYLLNLDQRRRYSMTELRDEIRLVLALNRALIAEVTANMRAVLIRRAGCDLVTRFVFYTPPSEDEIEAMGYIGTEVLANFRKETGSEVYEVMPSGRITIKSDEYLVFERKEEI